MHNCNLCSIFVLGNNDKLKTIKTMEKNVAFTEREINYIKSVEVGQPITDIRVLRKMEKMGLIVLHEQTGCIVGWYNENIKVSYIDECYKDFFVEGVGFFGKKFLSGCFNPYLVRKSTDKVVGIFTDFDTARAFRIANEGKVYVHYNAETKEKVFYRL